MIDIDRLIKIYNIILQYVPNKYLQYKKFLKWMKGYLWNHFIDKILFKFSKLTRKQSNGSRGQVSCSMAIYLSLIHISEPTRP